MRHVHPIVCHYFCQSNHTKEFQSEVKTYFCPDGKYNDMATLLFNSQEDAIKQLFHQDGKLFCTTCVVQIFLLHNKSEISVIINTVI